MNTLPPITPDQIAKLDELLATGLVNGNGNKKTTFCVEEAVCAARGLPITDQPACVQLAVGAFGRRLNDSRWASPRARAKGMRDFAIAQLGSEGVVDGREFAERLVIRTVREALPHWLRHAKIDRAIITACENAATRAEARDAARAASEVARKIYYYAANADVRAVTLALSARCAVEVLRELKSPGCAFLEDPR